MAELSQMEKSGPIRHEDMPDLVIVNKRGMIIRGGDEVRMASGIPTKAPYHFIDFAKMRDDYFWVSWLLAKLHDLSKLQHFVFPDYTAYFNPEMDNSSFMGFIKTQVEKLCRENELEPPPTP